MEKKKGLGIFGMILSLFFVVIGYYLYFEKSLEVGESQITLVKTIGIVSMIFFGALLILGAKRVFWK